MEAGLALLRGSEYKACFAHVQARSDARSSDTNSGQRSHHRQLEWVWGEAKPGKGVGEVSWIRAMRPEELREMRESDIGDGGSDAPLCARRLRSPSHALPLKTVQGQVAFQAQFQIQIQGPVGPSSRSSPLKKKKEILSMALPDPAWLQLMS
eukprot:1123434-Rhodomonas_salina.2